jgi:hypothetical protein
MNTNLLDELNLNLINAESKAAELQGLLAKISEQFQKLSKEASK